MSCEISKTVPDTFYLSYIDSLKRSWLKAKTNLKTNFHQLRSLLRRRRATIGNAFIAKTQLLPKITVPELNSYLRTYEMICFYFTGLADEDELMAHIAKLKKTRLVAGLSAKRAYVVECCALGELKFW